ncbi:MAG: Gfo/Idh/MocA family oxidoreductase [Planctomycetia bacterium]|nr:MAG: Gfo/Idh/MocA family oxidoreductase [Planctomycetia bacterium]
MRNESITRRQFVHTAAAAGAGLVLAGPGTSQGQDTAPGAKKADELAVAIIGPGSQGRNLLLKSLKIPGVRFLAVADIWPYAQRYAANILKKYDQPVNVYGDYREMLEREKSLDAVIIATPDWVHAEQTVACLKAGLHVYCEKEMSNTLEGARQMVMAARETKKLLQIGHQRRSNPRYTHALKLIENDRVLGKITHCYGQWNRARLYEIGWPKGEELDSATLAKYGYDSMDRFANWRWFRKYSGGAMADLGSHQVDVFSWVLRCNPRSVMASGGLDYYNAGEWAGKGREWYDNVMAIYEYPTPGGIVRASYQVLNTTSHGGYYEQFMGDEGSMIISEDAKKGQFWREVHAKRREWENESEKIESMDREAITLKIGETLSADGQKSPEGQALLEQSQKDIHQLHLENFFDAVRGTAQLTCPADVAYETCVSVLRANEAVEKGCRVEFAPSDFRA